MNLHPLDMSVLAAYLLAVTTMGFYFSKKNNSTEEYFLGGRRFGGWAIGLSMIGTAISSITFLAMPADAFKTTWLRYITYLGLPIAITIAVVYVVPIFRQGKITSVYEYLENRFGPSIRIYGSVTYLIAQLLRISMVLYLLALLVHEIMQVDLYTCVIASGLFVGLYTIVGGIDAVIWTDVFQTIILALGSIIGLIVIVYALPGGFEQIIDIGVAHHKFSFGAMIQGDIIPANWHFSLSEKSATMIMLVGISFFLGEYLSGQHMIQRYCAARSLREARKGLWVNLFIAMPVWTFYMLFGTALYVFFVVFPTPEMTEILNGTRKAEQVVPFFILHYLPAGLAGLLLAAALAAGMSSLDSSINAISTVTITDIYKRHLAQNQQDKHYLLMAKGVAAAATLLMMLGAAALINAETKTLQDTAFILTSIVTGGMLGLFVLALFTTKGDVRAVWIGIAATFIFTLWSILQQRGFLSPSLQMPFDLYYTGLLGNFLILILAYAVASLFPFTTATGSLDKLTVWTQKK